MHDIPVAIYHLHKTLTHSKTIKNVKKLLVFAESDSCRLSDFSDTHFFWNFDYFLEPTIKPVTGKSNSNSFEDKTCFYFRCVFQKKTRTLFC